MHSVINVAQGSPDEEQIDSDSDDQSESVSSDVSDTE